MKLFSSAILSALLLFISFTVHSEYSRVESNLLAKPQPQFHTVPADFPLISVSLLNEPTAPGFLFFTTHTLQSNNKQSRYAIIADNNGDLIFYRQIDDDLLANFTVQSNGNLTLSNWSEDYHMVLNNRYEVVEVVRGYVDREVDSHEFVITEDNHKLMIIYDNEVVDMSQIVLGGDPTALVQHLYLQELDENGNLVFEWNSKDHIPITDTIGIDLTAGAIDYIHGNSIEVDTDGNWLISSRSLNEITKINRTTGEIMWRMGGKANQFALFNDDKWFSRQHDVRRLPNGNISLFDNHWDQEGDSRYVEYYVDEETMTAFLMREYINPTRIHAEAMGNAQYIENGHVVIGWGSREPNSDTPAITEIGPLDERRLELRLESPVDDSQRIVVYRAFRHEWEGFPEKPVAVLAYMDGGFGLFYSANGLTKVEGKSYDWRVICRGGDGLHQVIDEQAHVQFEQGSFLSGADLGCDAYQAQLVAPSLATRLSSNWVELEKVFMPLVSQ